MLYNAKTKQVSIHGIPMYYTEFGYGETPLVILPGLSDGLRTVKGQALTLALYFKEFASCYRVYVFSRKEVLQEGCTTKDMAQDLKVALDTLGIEKLALMGVSQGGMVAQHFAMEYPEMVEKLVLAVSAARAGEVLPVALEQWKRYVENGEYTALMCDTMEKSYSPQKLKIYRLVYPLVGRMGKPKSFDRFLIQANACLTHNAYDDLGSIHCPTLIVGGDSDKIVGEAASPEMAAKIPGSKLHIYSGLGHAAYEEAKDFNSTVLRFLET